MTSAPSPFVRAAQDAAAALPSSGIAWLDAARRENLEIFAEAGLPEARNEAWKYTPLRALSQRAFALADAAAAADASIDPSLYALPGVDGARIVFVDGVFRADLSSLTAGKDVELAPLAQVLTRQPEPLRFVLANRYRHGAADAFAHLNAALAVDGVVLRIAEGAIVEQPIHIVHVSSGAQADTAWHARMLVEADKGSRASIVEQFVSAGDANQLGTVVADYVVREGATLDVTILQAASNVTTLVRRSHVRLDAHATSTAQFEHVHGTRQAAHLFR